MYFVTTQYGLSINNGVGVWNDYVYMWGMMGLGDVLNKLVMYQKDALIGK